MPYRIHEHKPPRPERTVQDTATPARLFAHNGTTAHFAFPCWYQEAHKPLPAHCHDHHRHDYHGWPSPTHPDHSCQLWSPDDHCCSVGHRHECSRHCEHYVDFSRVFPIHLREEGYTKAVVAWATEDRQPPEGIVVTAEIDEAEDWTVRVYMACNDPAALSEPATYKFTVFVTAPAAGKQPARSDIVVLAELVVLPSAYRG